MWAATHLTSQLFLTFSVSYHAHKHPGSLLKWSPHSKMTNGVCGLLVVSPWCGPHLCDQLCHRDRAGTQSLVRDGVIRYRPLRLPALCRPGEGRGGINWEQNFLPPPWKRKWFLIQNVTEQVVVSVRIRGWCCYLCALSCFHMSPWLTVTFIICWSAAFLYHCQVTHHTRVHFRSELVKIELRE